MRGLRIGAGAGGGAWMLAWIGVWPGAGAAAQELELVGTIAAPAGVVAISGDYAYLGDGPTLRVYDISDPAAAAAAGSVTLPAIIYDIAVAGTVAYAAMDFDGLATVDVSDPAAPRRLGTFRTPGHLRRGLTRRPPRTGGRRGGGHRDAALRRAGAGGCGRRGARAGRGDSPAWTCRTRRGGAEITLAALLSSESGGAGRFTAAP